VRLARRAAVVGLVAWLVGPAAAAAQQSRRISVRFEPNDRVVLGRTVDLVVELSGDGDLGEPRLGPLDGIEVVGTSRESRIEVTGGGFSRRSIIRFRLLPTRAGTLTLPPVRVPMAGAIQLVRPPDLVVMDAGGVAGAAARAGPPPVFASTRVDKREAWVGEQITLTFSFYRDPHVPLSENPDYDPPETPGFWRVDLDDEPALDAERIGGQLYQVQRFRYALFPLKAGRFRIGPATVRVVEPDPDEWWMSGRTRTLSTDPLDVLVDSLPSGAPPGFAGAVGRLGLGGAVAQRESGAGSPLQLELTVRGSGNASALPAPVLPDWADVDVRPPAVESASRVDGGTVVGQKTFRYVLIPRRTGVVDLGTVRLPYFDPGQGAYRTDSLRLGEIRVAPGAGGPARPVAAERPGPTLWTARVPRGPRVAGLAASPWTWVGLLGPWVAWLGALGAAGVRSRRRRGRAGRSAGPLTVARESIAAGEPGALGQARRSVAGILEARYGVALRGVGPAGRRAALAKAGVPRAVAAAAERAWDVIAEAEFAGGAPERAVIALAALESALAEDPGDDA